MLCRDCECEEATEFMDFAGKKLVKGYCKDCLERAVRKGHHDDWNPVAVPMISKNRVFAGKSRAGYNLIRNRKKS